MGLNLSSIEQEVLRHIHREAEEETSFTQTDLVSDGFSFLRDEGRVCSDAVNNAPLGAFADLIQVCGIDEDFHGTIPFVSLSMPSPYFISANWMQRRDGIVHWGPQTQNRIPKR